VCDLKNLFQLIVDILRSMYYFNEQLSNNKYLYRAGFIKAVLRVFQMTILRITEKCNLDPNEFRQNKENAIKIFNFSC